MHAQSFGIQVGLELLKKFVEVGEEAYTHLYTERVHKSKKVLFILYFQGTILKMRKFIEY